MADHRPSTHATRTLKLGGLAVAILVVVSGAALAANVHYKTAPSFTDDGLTLTARGTVVGVGNADLEITLTATAVPTSTCTNPAGSTQPGGQNPASVTVTGSQSIPLDEIKNGNARFSVTTTPPQSPVPGAPGCPNPRWTQAITDLAFTSATLTFRQGGAIVLETTCTFSPATVDGAILRSQVRC